MRRQRESRRCHARCLQHHRRIRGRGAGRGGDGADGRARGVAVATPQARRARSLGKRGNGMITVPAMRLQQFGVTLYQAILGARDVDRLVRFEVLSLRRRRAARAAEGQAQGKPKPSRVNWELLEQRIAESSEAYQRPVIRKKIAELVDYYIQCADTGNLPAVPGRGAPGRPTAGSSSRRPAATASSASSRFPPRAACCARSTGSIACSRCTRWWPTSAPTDVQVPAVIFDSLAPDQVVELFVTINAKHTKLNPSHLISLAGPAALSGQGARGQPRHHPHAERARRVAAARRDQALRRRPRPGRAGAAGRRAEEHLHRPRRPRRRAVGALPRGRAALLPELLQAGRARLPARLGGPEVQHQDRRRRCAPSSRVVPAVLARHPRRRRRRPRRPRHRACHRAVGRADRRPALRDRGRVAAEASRRHPRHGRGAGARAARRAPLLSVAPVPPCPPRPSSTT